MRKFAFFGCLTLLTLALGCGDDGGSRDDGGSSRDDGGSTRSDGGSTRSDGGANEDAGTLEACPEPTSCEDTCGSPSNPGSYVGDGDCDDGGEGSDFSICAFGTDCTDCGERDPSACEPSCEPNSMGVTCGECDGCGGFCPDQSQCDTRECGTDANGCNCGECEGDNEICTDEGQCEVCDCTGLECGINDQGCSCGTCEDAARCTDENQCEACDCSTIECGDNEAGCDCGDCDDGQFCNEPAGQVCETTSGTELCNNECTFAGDGDCDDGGPMCDFSLCDFGSDCADCGTRTEDQRPMEGEDLCDGGDTPGP
jgi:hypothetical protein